MTRTKKKVGRSKKTLAELCNVIIDRSDVISEITELNPEFRNVEELYAWCVENRISVYRGAQLYERMQEAGWVDEKVFSELRKTEFKLGVYQKLRSHRPVYERMSDFLPGAPEGAEDNGDNDHERPIGPVFAKTQDGSRAARYYLNRYALGHVESMLKRLHANGEDVREEANRFVSLVYELVDQLENGE